MKQGLEDVVAADSAICAIDGARGILAYRGIDIHELAEKSTFEEVCFLLWEGRLPRRAELDETAAEIGRGRLLPSAATKLLGALAGSLSPMDALRTLVSALPASDPDGASMSTFAARVTAATLADLHAAVTAAIAALKGPLHGGANEAVMRMLLEIGSLDRVDVYVRDKLARREKIMGFGHRVYTTEDPRATHLREMSKAVSESSGDTRWYAMSRRIEQVVREEKALNANVDFYSASLYQMLGIPIELFTPVFAVSRISGWTAHVLEQYANNRLIRPRAEYTGPVYPQEYVEMARR